MPEEFKAKIQRWLEAWNTGDLVMLDDVFAVDIIYHMPPFPDMMGLEAHKRFIADARRSYPNFDLTLDEIIVQGHTTATRFTWRGTFAGPSSTIPMPPPGSREPH